MPKIIRFVCALLVSIFLTAGPAQSRESAGRILVIGDSLTVGGFGETLQELLSKRYGADNVFVYGSCGSAPQHWLTVEPVHVTKCGYRGWTPKGPIVLDYQQGRRPPPVQTPKIERLLWQHKPQVVIVQLGTNWFDDLLGHGADEEAKKMSQALDRLAQSLRGRQVIWVLPPDTTKFSHAVQNTVRQLIAKAGRTWRFDWIDSVQLTHYVNGRTGSDGVHYSSEAGADWARGVMKQLQKKIRTDSGPRVFFSDDNG